MWHHRGLAEGVVELKPRTGGDVEKVPLDAIVETVKTRLVALAAAGSGR